MVKTYIKNLKLFKKVYLNKILTIDKVESYFIRVNDIFIHITRASRTNTDIII